MTTTYNLKSGRGLVPTAGPIAWFISVMEAMGSWLGFTGTWTPLSHSCFHWSVMSQYASGASCSESGSFIALIKSFRNNYQDREYGSERFWHAMICHSQLNIPQQGALRPIDYKCWVFSPGLEHPRAQQTPGYLPQRRNHPHPQGASPSFV